MSHLRDKRAGRRGLQNGWCGLVEASVSLGSRKTGPQAILGWNARVSPWPGPLRESGWSGCS